MLTPVQSGWRISAYNEFIVHYFNFLIFEDVHNRTWGEEKYELMENFKIEE